MDTQQAGSCGVVIKVVATVLMTCGVMLTTLGIGMSAASGGSRAAAQEKAHVLVLADLPKGWTVEKGSNASTGSNNFPGAKQLAACIGVPSKLITANPPQVNSPYFQSKDGSLEVQESISLFPTIKAANAQFDAIGNAKAPSCMTTLVNAAPFKSHLAAASGHGATIGTIAVTKANPANYAKNTTNITLTIPITYQGMLISAKITEIFFVDGTLGGHVSFNSYDTSFPASVSKRVTIAAESRM